jgi:nicotinate-nucleotide adenylyltransferase
VTVATSETSEFSSPEGRPAHRIGLLGGTFDPPHIGHLVLGSCALAHGGLDEVRFVVANDPWQKSGEREITAAHHRLAMVDLAIAGDDRMQVSDVEIVRGGKSYTIDTVSTIRAAYEESSDGDAPELRLALVVGSDVVSGLNTWHRADELQTMVDLVVATRPGSTDAEPPAGWTWSRIDMPRLDVSSTGLRWRLAEGRSVDHIVTVPVLDYIAKENLYRE